MQSDQFTDIEYVLQRKMTFKASYSCSGGRFFKEALDIQHLCFMDPQDN